MIKLRFFSLLLAALFAGTLLGGSAQAQPSFSGTYVLDEAASDDVVEAFEPAIREMNYVVRQIARSRLRQTVQPDQQIHIEQDDAEATFQIGDRATFRVPLDGRPVRQQTERNEVVERRASLEGGVLRLQAGTDEGGQTSAYRLSPDGRRLTVDVTISAEQLPQPVRYTLVYHRQ